MALNNAYKMYRVLFNWNTLGRRLLDMGKALRELTHDLLQRGLTIRKLRAEHPSWTQAGQSCLGGLAAGAFAWMLLVLCQFGQGQFLSKCLLRKIMLFGSMRRKEHHLGWSIRATWGENRGSVVGMIAEERRQAWQIALAAQQ
jgi:hypothetical protein